MSMVKSARELTTNARKHIAGKNFAFEQERRYPIHDLRHARNALSRVSASGTPAEKAEVRREVYSKYPGLKARKEKRLKLGGKK